MIFRRSKWKYKYRVIGFIGIFVFYVICWIFVDVDISRLIQGLPKLGKWLKESWPPDFSEWDIYLIRASETVAMATLGTTIAALLALPIAWLAAYNVTPSRFLYYPIRWFLNVLRGIDSFIFALIFVAAVGLGPFAGVLGVGIHTWGSMAKLYAENIESANLYPFRAAIATGTSRTKAVLYILLPEVTPSLFSISLFWWEFNVRASTVLGLVGAGGIGQILKNSMDLMDFQRVLAVILVILLVVTIIDWFSAWLRSKIS